MSAEHIKFSAEEEALGRANYEAFHEATRAWQPAPADWDRQSERVKRGWILGAREVLAKWKLDTTIRAGAFPAEGEA